MANPSASSGMITRSASGYASDSGASVAPSVLLPLNGEDTCSINQPTGVCSFTLSPPSRRDSNGLPCTPKSSMILTVFLARLYFIALNAVLKFGTCELNTGWMPGRFWLVAARKVCGARHPRERSKSPAHRLPYHETYFLAPSDGTEALSCSVSAAQDCERVSLGATN
eukprot:3263325-Rhodomonas_salina.3